jgi:hypothetical protein
MRAMSLASEGETAANAVGAAKDSDINMREAIREGIGLLVSNLERLRNYGVEASCHGRSGVGSEKENAQRGLPVRTGWVFPRILDGCAKRGRESTNLRHPPQVEFSVTHRSVT